MSVSAITAVWRYSQAPDVGSLLILLALADWCDDEGYCWPSRRAIAYKTGASIATVKRALRQHVGRHELEKVAVGGHTVPSPREFVGPTGFQPTNLYRLSLIDKLGTKRPDPLALARNQGGVRLTPPCQSRGGHTDPQGGVIQTPKGGSGSASPLLYPSEEPSEEPLDQGQGRGTAPTRTPDDNLAVIGKLAHEVMDLLAETPDVDFGEVAEAVKRHCAVLEIAYDSGVVTKAINSACYQRRQVGKPSVIPWLGVAPDEPERR